MVAGFGLQPHVGVRATPVLAAGGTLSALGAYLFILNMWRTINGPSPRPMPLPVVVR